MTSLRQILAISFLALSLGACQADKEEAAPQTFTGTWRLDTVVSGSVGHTFSANDLGYDQYYRLFDDNTFQKMRSTGAIAKGSYTLETIEGKLYAVLDVKESLEQGNFLSIVASCTPGRLYLYLEGDTLHDNNLACDIGNYMYRRVSAQSK